ncbi:MAG TPA: hypothetical protein VE619_04270 [Nitrososphaeraceae archaeon]|jgi:hypothetical protein|nr:hypothetical protein [Nitrososphaeraceae archaeon]
MQLAEYIFNTLGNEHLLLYEKQSGVRKWVTTDDLDYMSLVMIYALLRLAWEKNILIIGLVKDIAAAELIKTEIPLLEILFDCKDSPELLTK